MELINNNVVDESPEYRLPSLDNNNSQKLDAREIKSNQYNEIEGNEYLMQIICNWH